MIFEDFSECPICGQMLRASEEYVIIPPLISNENDPIFIFSDAGIHWECLKKSKIKEEILFHRKRYDEISAKYRSMINLGGAEDLVFFGLLSSVVSEPLYKFNYIILNKNSINIWEDKTEFIEIASEFLAEGKWKNKADFNYLRYLVDLIS